MENHVTVTDDYIPLTGAMSVEADISGWRWDRRLLIDLDRDETFYRTWLGGHEAGLLDGTWLQQWQSGTLEGLSWQGISRHPSGDEIGWHPIVEIGRCSFHWDDRQIYSDYSVSSNVDPAYSAEGRHRLALPDDVLDSTIHARIMKRVDNLVVTLVEYQLVDEFTGEVSGESRLETIDEDGEILWNNLSTRHPEIKVDGSWLLFSDARQVEVDSEPQGVGRQGRRLFLKYFPVTEVTVSADGLSWLEVDSLDLSGPADRHYSINHDLGVIQLGGLESPALQLDDELSWSDTEVDVVLDTESIASWPQTGILQIGDEKVYYGARTRSAFIECVRGWDGTIAADHQAGATVSNPVRGIWPSGEVMVSYKAVPRVDFEVTSYGQRTALEVDVRPSRNRDPRHILQLVSRDDDLAEITLETDSELIGGNLHGPVYFGTDTSRLTATAYDSQGAVVEDQELTIWIVSGPGGLNGTATSVTDETDTSGEMFCFYNAPYDADSVFLEVSSIRHEGAGTVLTVPSLASGVMAEDVWVFQVLKHDGVIGTSGTRISIYDGGSTSEPWGLGWVDVWMVPTEDYDGGGVLRFIDATGVSRTATIRSHLKITSSGQTATRFYLEEAFDASWLGGGELIARVISPAETEWNAALLNGVKVIVYEWSEGAVHPLSGEEGAYTPVHPDSVSGTELVFAGRQLPLPAPTDDDSNLGGYLVVASSEVRLRARGRDPFTGNVITSNDIRLKLDLPLSLVGVDSSGVLPVPYGWTLPTEDFNVASGLGGANFVTINPLAEGIHQLGLTWEF